MSDSDRKEPSREESERSSGRSGVFRRGRRKSEPDTASAKGDEAAKSKPGTTSESKPPSESEQSKPQATTSEQKSGDAATGGLDHSGKVSSLLETTGEDVKQLLKAADDASKSIREAAQTEASDSTAQDAKGGGETTGLVGRINKEVQQVLESADEAADKIRKEARGEARQVIEEARRRAEAVTKQQMNRVSEMTDQVLGELSGVKGRLERLQGAYDQAMKTMDAELGVQESRVWETQQNGEVEPDQGTDALRRRLGKRTPRKGAEQPEGISEGARLLAMQQMMAGVEPEIIERRLRTEFGIEDPKPILDWMGLHGAPPKPAQKSKKR